MRFALLLTALQGIGGCKIALIVPAGGTVSSSSALRDCLGGTSGNYCTFDLSSVALPFEESFTATPIAGYQFVRWQGGEGFLCKDLMEPVCTVQIADDHFGAALLANYETAYIMPVFRDVGFDTDDDGTFDRLDLDDDNDGIPDIDDPCPLTRACGFTTIEQLVLNNCTTSGEVVSQTFTATRSGNLTGMRFAVESSFLDQLVTRVYAGDGDGGSLLYSEFGIMDAGPATALRNINFGSVPLMAGQLYTIELYAGEGMSWSVCGSSLNPYDQGKAAATGLNDAWDLGFRLQINY